MTRFPILLTLGLLSQNTFGGLVVADFNDNIQATLGSFTEGAGQGGGFGWLGGDVWANTGTIFVIANDLTAPVSTGYSVSQTGPGQSAQGNSVPGRHTTRSVESPLTGTVWFSFLLNQQTLDSRGGISFNQNASSPGNPRIVATGTEVRLGLGATLQAEGEGANLLTIGETALILGRLVIDSGGAPEILDVWINPDLSTGADGLPAPDTTLTVEAAILDGGVTRVGVQSYSADAMGGIVDSVRLSDQDQAFDEVTSDVELNPDDPNLSVSLSNPFDGITLTPLDSPLAVDIPVTNIGETNTLSIATSSGISGDDATSYTILTPLPLDIAPGATASLLVQLDPSGAPRASSAILQLDSNDTSNATVQIPLSSRILSADGNQLLNPGFEDDPATPVNWTFNDVSIVEGVAPGSTNSASLTGGANLGQAVSGNAEWFAECFFQSPDTPDRAFNLLVDAPGGNINLRFQGTSAGAGQSWNLFDQATLNDAWGEAIALPPVQPGATYFIRITGKGWDGVAPTYDLELSAPNSTAIAGTVSGLDRFQAATPTGAPTQIRLSAQFGNSPGFVVDEVKFANGTPPPAGPPVITSIVYDRDGQTTTLTYQAQIGVGYLIFGSDNLVDWTELGDPTAESTTETFTETAVTSAKRFYYVATAP